jgi:hypothetical protein
LTPVAPPPPPTLDGAVGQIGVAELGDANASSRMASMRSAMLAR